MEQCVIAVVGPTGSGKTALGKKLAEKFDGVILSADSRQVYQGLTIGSNKEGRSGQWHGLPAHFLDETAQLLIDITRPGQRFTVADWLEEAQSALKLIKQEGKTPVIVGGTGLYVTALLSGWVLPALPLKPLILMLDVDRATLYDRADKRYEQIFDSLVTEVNQLYKKGVDLLWLKRLGLDYKFACQYISNEYSREEAIKLFQFAEHAYIRRQLTWWRHHEPVRLVKTFEEAENLATQFLKSCA